MSRSTQLEKLKPPMLMATILLTVAACRLGAEPTLEPPASPTPASPTPAEPQPAPIPEPTATELADVPLSVDGPWLLLGGKDGLWAVNDDGSGMTHIVNRSDRGPSDRNYRVEPSPGGGLAAVIEIESRNGLAPPILHLLFVPGGLLSQLAQLHPDEVTQDGFPISIDRWAATGVWNEVAFSPDGLYLAFNAVIDGQSGDLYLFELETSALTRLTDGPTESVLPYWSPDGAYIVHGAAELLNYNASGSGYDYTGVWSAAADGSSIDLLFESDINGFERVVGWLDDATVLMDSDTPFNPFCSYHDLRAVNVRTGETETLLAGGYSARAFDSETGTLSFSILRDPPCNDLFSSGIYVMDLAARTAPFQVVEDDVFQIFWSPAGELFLAEAEFGVLAVARSGQFIDLVNPEGTLGRPLIAPGSRRLAWNHEGVWIGTLQDNIDQLPTQIHPERVQKLTWSPNGEHLFLIEHEMIYVAAAPDFVPILVGSVSVGDPVWVLP